jgi:transglutaminase-like putative cysteine protease
MAEMGWTRLDTSAAPLPSRLARFIGGLLDWEDCLTFGLALGAMLAVVLSIERAGWSRDMPALGLVGLLALIFALLVARSPLHTLLAWPLAAITGAGVTFWQTMAMVGPGSLEHRVDAIYFRFETWFHLAFTGGITNDSLPFNVMMVGLTWSGVFLFGWSVFRWHNAWLGLIPGGVALFLSLLFTTDQLPLGLFLYAVFGLTLVMRANLTARMQRWRAESVSYPPLISLSFLHFTTWAALCLVVAAWTAPVGPFPTPGPADAIIHRLEGMAVQFVRLAGPLHLKRASPVHDFTAILPFQGSIDLSERELLSVKVGDPLVEGPIILRGAVYDEYASGGWKAGPRREVDLPSALDIEQGPGDYSSAGRIIPVAVTVKAKSVVGSVLFTPGQFSSTDVPAQADLPEGSFTEMGVKAVSNPSAASRGAVVHVPEDGGVSLTDDEVLALTPPGWAGLYVRRDDAARVLRVGAVPSSQLPDFAVVRPRERLQEGESYNVLGFVSDVSPAELRAARSSYPSWILDSYLQLPSMPARVSRLAWDVAGKEATTYDRVKAIETYLREYPVDYTIDDTPPGQDTVDYFLFEARRGYFDYHASAMVVMLRHIGIPSRLAVGFVLDRQDFDMDSSMYTVQGRDAYSWVEVYFPDHGWVEFNPSPDRPAELRTTEGSNEISVPLNILKGLEGLPILDDSVFPIEPGDDAAPGDSPTSGGSGLDFGSWPWVALAVGAFMVAVLSSGALVWRRSVAGLPYPQQLWEKTVRVASWAGLPPRPGQTPIEFARFLGHRLKGAGDIDLLAQAYSRSRFGRNDVNGEDRQHLRRVWIGLRRRLVWEIIRRPSRRG